MTLGERSLSSGVGIGGCCRRTDFDLGDFAWLPLGQLQREVAPPNSVPRPEISRPWSMECGLWQLCVRVGR